jgi:hypothetical protein
MTRITIVIAAGLAFAATLPAAPAQAQRVFVSATGADGNPCTFASPCRTFQHAHDTVAAGGEIDVLDPAGYGSLTINKSISIQGHGYSGISVASGGVGIAINALTGIVNLSGLIIEGAGVGQTGIQFNTGASLTIANCIVRTVTSDGIDFEPSSTSSLTVSDTFIANNGADGILIGANGVGTMVTAVFNRVESVNNLNGFVMGAVSHATGQAILATATDSVAAGNSGTGFMAFNNVSGNTQSFMVSRSVAANNGTGVAANGFGATVWIGQSTVTGNSQGWGTMSGAVQSFGTNQGIANLGGQSQPPAVSGGFN